MAKVFIEFKVENKLTINPWKFFFFPNLIFKVCAKRERKRANKKEKKKKKRKELKEKHKMKEGKRKKRKRKQDMQLFGDLNKEKR